MWAGVRVLIRILPHGLTYVSVSERVTCILRSALVCMRLLFRNMLFVTSQMPLVQPSSHIES